MDPLRLVLSPARLGLRALDDLHSLAQTVQASARERELLLERLELLRAEVSELNLNTVRVCAQAGELLVIGRSLRAEAERLRLEAGELSGDMKPVAEAIERVEEAGETIEEVAEGVQPIRGAAERMGRVAERLTRSRDRG